eukprot:scaffold3.g6450.t1
MRRAHAPTPARRRRARWTSPPAAIGFDLRGADDAPGNSHRAIEKRAEELTRLAASLLLYQPVLRGKPATAFLNLLESWGELFRLLATDQHSSWAEYVQEQVLRGVDNPLARAAARGEETSHLHAAAAADLDVLQQLAIADADLAEWVAESTFGVPDLWRAAASGLRTPPSPPATAAAFSLPASPPPALLGPLPDERRVAARGLLSGQQDWSEAVDEVDAFYRAYGHGLLPNHRVLVWSGSKLEGQDALKGVNALPVAEEEGLVAHEHHATKTLAAALSTFLSAPLDVAATTVPPHAAVVGAPRDRWLLAVYALERLPRLVEPELAGAAAGARVVLLPAAQLATLPDLAWSLAQHPRCRFVVVASCLEGYGAKNELAAVLSGYGGFSWPQNAVVLGGFETGVPPALADVFAAERVASIEDVRYCA